MSTIKANKIENLSTSDGGITIDNNGNVEFMGNGATQVPKGSTAQRPGSPADGMVRINTDLDHMEWYDGVTGMWKNFTELDGYSLEYLVVGGGGGTGTSWPKGGGGGGGVLNGTKKITLSTNYSVTVGAGGPANTTDCDGSDSIFGTYTAGGGGGGSTFGGAGRTGRATGGSGGGGGGGGAGALGSSGGFPGGGSTSSSSFYNGGGGGGAGGAGEDGTNTDVGAGGPGLSNDITGSAVFYGGGGGGGGGNGANLHTGTNGSTSTGSNGAANTGAGGGANTGANATSTGTGGSGVVIFRYPNTLNISQSGLTLSTTTDGNDKVTTVTAGTGTVSWSTS